MGFESSILSKIFIVALAAGATAFPNPQTADPVDPANPADADPVPTPVFTLYPRVSHAIDDR